MTRPAPGVDRVRAERGGTGGRGTQGRRTARDVRRNWLFLLFGLLSAAILATSGISWAWVRHMDGQLDRIDPFKGLDERPGGGSDDDLTFLIVGTDNRAGVPKATLRKLHAGGESCDCTDTIMLVHVNGKRDRATVVSLPRDSYVTFPAHRDKKTGVERPESKGKINAAYTLGGAPLTVATVERATGVRVDHYIEVNFLSFVSVVDTLGGIEMCTPKPLRDPKSGLDLPAGKSRLDGVQALQYVRARYIASDPTGDIGRTQRQQKFMTQVLAQATGSGTLTDPLKLKRVVDAVLGSITVDEKLRPQTMLDLGAKLRNLSNSGVTHAQVPLASMDHQVPDWGSTVLWDEAGARTLFEAIRDDRPLDPKGQDKPKTPSGPGASTPPATPGVEVPPAEVTVRVLNGTRIQGLGTRAHNDLAAAGFATAGQPRNAGVPEAVGTVIRYDPRWDRSVKTVQAALPGATAEPVPGLGGVMEVVVGSSYAGVTPVHVAPAGDTGNGPDGAETPKPAYTAKSGDEVSCK